MSVVGEGGEWWMVVVRSGGGRWWWLVVLGGIGGDPHLYYESDEGLPCEKGRGERG